MLGGPAITDARFERGRPFPPEFRTADRLRLSACRGEYEPTTFVLYTDEPRANVRVTATDLKGREGTIPSVAVDLRVVKYWYQAGDFGKPEGRLPAYDIAMLLPELLLKDDNLVVVNHEQRKNYMRIDGELVDVTDPTPEFNVEGWPAVENPRLQNLAPKDAATLLPFDVGADEIKQVFVTVHVPDKAAAGTYKGEIEVTAGPHGSLKLPMTVNVYPFDLAPCPIDYSIYTRSFIDDAPKVPCFSEQKTPEQYRAEMANLFAHGIVNPQVNDIKFERFEQAMRIREEVGMPKGHIYHHGVRIPRDELDSDEALAKWEARIRRFSTWAREHGYGSFYAYAIDEADPLLHKQRRWIEAAHRAGGKVFVSVEDDAGFFEIAGDVLDLPIMSGPVQPRIARLVQKNGHRLGIYAFPQVTWEKPEIFRRNYGIRLWLAGYDVEMTYAYQHSFGHIWNDFDYKGDYKDHCLAYPTVNGVVDTLVFEGLREAVDDTRYIATFLTESKHPDHPAEVAASADKWLHSLDPEQDLHEMRRKIATAIIRAMQERGARQVKRVAGHR
ncbi:MAG: hypothetical protein CMJ18_28360 [Phycisphaeraceae bacterium]|nr:hypothetical protein [Phycisphaeraceae bacterium]